MTSTVHSGQTSTDLDEERVDGIVVFDDGSSHEDGHVTNASKHGHYPHCRAQDGVLQQVVAAGDSVTFRLAVADVSGVGAHVKRVEVTETVKQHAV